MMVMGFCEGVDGGTVSNDCRLSLC
jgi:hypothetical protein